MHTDDDQTFSGRQAAAIAGISYRQLDYWARTDMIRPSAHDASGSGSRRAYTHRDVVDLAMVSELRDRGVHLQTIRTVADQLRSRSLEGFDGQVVISVHGVTFAETVAELLDALDNPTSIVVSVPPIREALAGRLAELEEELVQEAVRAEARAW